MSKWNNPVHNFALKSPYGLHEDNEECWVWTGARDKDGYGVFTLNKRKTPAHVAAYILAQGEVPAGMYVLHKCHNSGCVNPNHLYVGTQRQNIQDQIDAGTFVYGSKNGMAKLTENIVREIRASDKPYRELAIQHNVSHYTVWDVLKGRSWQHLK